MKLLHILFAGVISTILAGCLSARVVQVTPRNISKWIETEYPYQTEYLETGTVYRLTKDMVLTTSTAPGRFYLTRFGYSELPRSTAEYKNSPEKWREHMRGIVLAGTLLCGERVERFYPQLLSSDIDWLGVTCRILNGEHKGKLIIPSGWAFSEVGSIQNKPDPEYLEVANSSDPDIHKLIQMPEKP